ncbi:MAG TPA: ROK family transcriptional regulator [Pseudolysinimonas sp.]|nr:ROK family transcriptional regulator [Pseudolysinimonas sp.]
MPREVAPSLVSGDVRRHNLSLVMGLLAQRPSARSEISAATGLTRGAVTALVNQLLEAGLVRESGQSAASKGRPLTNLELWAEDVALLAVQLASDEATALLTDLAGEPVHRGSLPHHRPMGDPDAVLDVVARVVEDALAVARAQGRRVVDMTVVVLAPVGGSPPKVVGDLSLGWGEVDVLAGLRARVPALEGQLRLSTDMPLAALAELRHLGPIDDAVYLKADSNIGGALVVGGRVIEGAHGLGGALAHVPVVRDGLLCDCGQHGCLVTVAGIDALLVAEGRDPGEARESPSAALGAFVGRVEAGYASARSAWDGALPVIAATLQILASALDPRVVIVGGHWARLSASIAGAFAANRADIVAVGSPLGATVVAGPLGPDAGLRGAIEAARARQLADPLRIKFNS